MTKGIKFAILTAIISGISIFVNKFAVSAIKPPLIFTMSKNIMVGILILTILLISKKWQLVKKLKKQEIIKLSFIGLIGGSIPFYLFFEGLSQTSAINSNLIHKSLVFWVTLLSLRFLREKLNFKQVLAVLILFSSNLVIGGFEGFTFNQGELMILGATLFWAVENIIAKKTLKTVDADIVTGARMGLGSMVLLVFALIKYPGFVDKISLDGTQLFWLILTCLTLLGYVMSWYRALKYEKVITVTAVLVGATIVTNLLSAIFITRVWTMDMGYQASLIILGIYFFVTETNRVKIKDEVMTKV